jgi:hypothetical protein
MVDGAVPGKLAAKFSIARKLIGHQIRVAVHNAHYSLTQCLRCHVRDVKRVAVAVAVNQRQNRVFLRFFLRIGTVFHLAADHAFIGLDNLVLAAKSARASQASSLHGCDGT